ncbi:unnamed protein product [Ectocarpus sp. CCAP 1310/34]|nr:unnamed protein product [Ectocarpus sp. CCAP 1310/34]
MLLRGVHGRLCKPLAHARALGVVRLGPNLEACAFGTDTRQQEPKRRTVVAEAGHLMKLYSQLSKHRLSALVMSTTSAGYLAAGGPVDALALTSACVGTMLASSSANTFNQVIETANDARMHRTRARPLPSGRISRQHALGWGVASGTAGISVLAAGSNPLTATLGAANLLLYVGPYTLSKTRSEINTWVGSVVGAVPPLMGWAAATGELVAVEPLLLATYLFMWQFPHFFSLAWLHREDYARGGFAMVPCADPTGSRTASLVTRYSWYLVPIPLAAAALDATSWMFAVEGTAFNAYLLYHAYRFDKDKSNANARGVFKASLWHLPAVLALFVFHSRRWELEDKAEDEQLSTLIPRIRARLTKLCLHEIVQKDEAASFCPVVVVEAAGTEAQNIATAAAHKEESLLARSDTGS